MEMFVEHPGLCHIGKKVLKFADFQSLLACRLVRKSWKNQIEKITSKIKLNVNDLENVLWIKTTRDKAFKTSLFKNVYQYEWRKFMEELKRVSNPLINYYFLRFLSDERIDFQKLSPLEAFVKVGNLKMVEFIMNSPINISVGPYNYFWNGVNNAAENSQIEMLKILKSFHPNFLE